MRVAFTSKGAAGCDVKSLNSIFSDLRVEYAARWSRSSVFEPMLEGLRYITKLLGFLISGIMNEN